METFLLSLVTYYIIEIYKKGYDKWNLEKRFREFDDLDKALKKLYGNLPVIPGKTLLTLKESAEIERRRGQLEKYLQVFQNLLHWLKHE